MPFTAESITFLKQLKKNNRRDWFEKNKSRYESLIREPSLEFITEIGPLLQKITPHFLAIPRKMGGSLMRVYRDTRFSKDKKPYKTNVGIHFRHEFGKDVHAPGYYLHIEPEGCFVGMGIWHPESAALKKIRNHLVENTESWLKVTRSKMFKQDFELAGDSLKKAPLGFDKDHPQIVDLRRKDFIAVKNFDATDIFHPGFVKSIAGEFKKGTPLMRFLCDALQVPF